MKEIKINTSGIFPVLLQITFIVLKLCNVIDWSWLWVLAPTWIPVAIVIGLFLIVGIIGFTIGVIKGIHEVKRKK